MKYPMSDLQDVPIKVGDLYVSINFMILEMKDDIHPPIILRRLLLATIRCRVDVKNGKLSFDVWSDHVEFNLFKASKFPLFLMGATELMWLIIW